MNETNVTVGAGRSVQVAFNYTIDNPGIRLAGIGSLTPVNVRVLIEPTLSNLSITPLSGVSPHRIIVTAMVSTTEEGSGNYTARLYIDGVNVLNRTVNVPAGEEVTVSFTYNITQRGNHTVWIDNPPGINVNALKPATLEVRSFSVTRQALLDQ